MNWTRINRFSETVGDIVWAIIKAWPSATIQGGFEPHHREFPGRYWGSLDASQSEGR